MNKLHIFLIHTSSHSLNAAACRSNIRYNSSIFHFKSSVARGLYKNARKSHIRTEIAFGSVFHLFSVDSSRRLNGTHRHPFAFKINWLKFGVVLVVAFVVDVVRWYLFYLLVVGSSSTHTHTAYWHTQYTCKQLLT